MNSNPRIFSMRTAFAKSRVFLFAYLVVASGSLAIAQLLTPGANLQAVTYDTPNTGLPGTSRSIPPNCVGDIGPTQFLVCVNGRIRTFNRSGAPDGAIEMTSDAFFASVRGVAPSGGPTADPRVRYDRLSGRWFVTMRTVSVPPNANLMLIAVSSGSTIANIGSFTFFQFPVTVDPTFPANSFIDFPSLGVDKFALYIGANVFEFNPDAPQSPIYNGTAAYVVNKANLIAGTLTVTPLGQLPFGLTNDIESPQGVDNDDPAATEGYFVGADIHNFDQLDVARISNPGGTPTVSAQYIIAVPSTNYPTGGVLARGSTLALDDVDDSLLVARMHKGRLWTTHNISVLSSGMSPVYPAAGDRDASRWYEIGTLSGTPSLSKWGTVFDPTVITANSHPREYWMPSCAMSGQGSMAIVSSVARAGTGTTSPPGEFAGIAASGRFDTDAAGNFGTPAAMQAAIIPQVGLGAYNLDVFPGVTSPQRWGDYSMVTVDPLDDMTFWSVHEYCNGADSWGVRVIQFNAPPPATPASATQPSVEQGRPNVNVTITGTSAAGSGFFDPGAGYANHISATVGGAGVTVNSISYSDPTHITLNVSVAFNAAPGARTVTVTNPDGQTVASASGILTVAAPVDTDGDGMPDWWEDLYGLNKNSNADAALDSDGDGTSNLNEYRAGTDPRNPASVLRITSIAKNGSGAQITFTSLAGKSYRLVFKDALSDATWTVVADNIPGQAGTTTTPDPAAVGMQRRYYKVFAIFP